jgi:cytochrome P450/NADPH-cytochrome P450 reductase
MMTFMVYFLLKNPEKLRKLRAQIDEVLGEREVQYEDFAKLPYLIGALFLLRFPYLLPLFPFLSFFHRYFIHIVNSKTNSIPHAAVMRETLRLAATAPMRSTTPIADTTLGGGKYAVKKGTAIVIQTWELHRDPAVWGDDVRSSFSNSLSFVMLMRNLHRHRPTSFGLSGCSTGSLRRSRRMRGSRYVLKSNAR